MKRARKSGSRKTERGGRKNQSEDRLSDLPDSILLHIMSFMTLQYAVQTCVLSKRWKGLWKCIPNLIVHTKDFTTYSSFTEFLSGIVSYRDDGDGDHPLLSLDFYRRYYLGPQYLIDLLRYAVSHSVQQLKVFVPYNIGLPSFVFSCQSLTSLDISVSSYDLKRLTRMPKSIELPSLVNLRLESIAIFTGDNGRAEPFSGCKKLKNLCLDNPVLILPDLNIHWSGTLVISNASLTNFTLDDYSFFQIVVSTPNLSSFTVNGYPFQKLQGQQGINIELQSSSSMK